MLTPVNVPRRHSEKFQVLLCRSSPPHDLAITALDSLLLSYGRLRIFSEHPQVNIGKSDLIEILFLKDYL